MDNILQTTVATVEVKEWISNSILHLTEHVITIHAGIEVNPC